MWRAVAGLALAASAALGGAADEAWRKKVDPRVLEAASEKREAEFIAFLGDQADVSETLRLSTKRQKGRYVYERLTAVARRSQGPILAALSERGVEHRPFWIANMIWVRGDLKIVEELARTPQVAHVYANPRVRMELPTPELRASAGEVRAAVEPSIKHTGARRVFWKAGFRGQGIVIGGQDTGYEWDHPAIRSQYRGWSAGGVDHDYNWHDAIHSGGGICGADSPEPCDDDDHGTYTMGIIVGDDGGANRIGMAPGAQWIGCRNMDVRVGTPASYSECFEWFIAPTTVEGRRPDPDMAPDVINNSWVCPPAEGCEEPGVLSTVIRNTRAAGILVVAAAGNGGPDCETIETPPAIYGSALTVGATTNQDGIAAFSSRGPVTVDGSGRMKPDMVAPGVGIRSSIRGGGYNSFIGTSASAPHVAGMAALVLSAGSCLRGKVGALENHLLGTALPIPSDEQCGGFDTTSVPNPTYGYGALRAAVPACGRGISGSTSGLLTARLVCRNRSSRQERSMPLGGADSWSCAAAGLTAAPGDRLKIRVTASVRAEVVRGTVEGIVNPKVLCESTSGGGVGTIRAEADGAWDCGEAGVELVPGDRLKLVFSGKAS